MITVAPHFDASGGGLPPIEVFESQAYQVSCTKNFISRAGRARKYGSQLGQAARPEIALSGS